jgi:hypothetical protein
MLALPALKRGVESVEPALPQRPVLTDPRAQLPERLGAQRVKASRAVGPDLDEPRLLEDAQVPRNAGLMNVHPGDNVVHGLLALKQRFDDLKAAGTSQRLEHM